MNGLILVGVTLTNAKGTKGNLQDPCITRRGAQLCKKICGEELATFAEGVKIPGIHPWAHACIRNALLNRCGPGGVYCWNSDTREQIQISAEPERRNGTEKRKPPLPRCRPGKPGALKKGSDPPDQGRGDIALDSIGWHTPFHSPELQNLVEERENRTRRVGDLMKHGFASIINLRAENDSTTRVYGKGGIPTNIRKWHKWPGNTQKKRVGEDQHPQKIRLAKLQLRFTKEILRPKITPDLESLWVSYGLQLRSVENLRDLDTPPTEWSAADLWGRNPGSDITTFGQLQPWGYGPKPLTKPQEAGVEFFLKGSLIRPEDALKIEVCLSDPNISEEIEKYLQEQTVPGEENPGLQTIRDNLKTLMLKDEPSTNLRTTAPPKTRERVNRSANPNRAVKQHNGPFSNTLDQRIATWMRTQGQSTSVGGRRQKPPFMGIAGNLQKTWSERQGSDDTWKLLKSDVSQSQVTTSQGVEGSAEWKVVGKASVYDQEVTLEITTPISPLVDTMDDLTFHLDTQYAMKKEEVEGGQRKTTDNSWYWGTLQSLRGHPDLNDGDADELKKALQKFRLFEQGSTDHALELNGKVALSCQRRTWITLRQQRFINHDGTEADPTAPPTSKLKRSLTAIASAVAGTAGFLFGLITNRPHVGAEVEGLQDSVFNLHKRTAAMMRAEAIMKTKTFMVDQGVAAARRVALSNSGALAVCESGQTLRKIFGELRQGRVHASLFQGESEMQETLTEVEEELLEPHQLGLLISKKDCPEQLLNWPAAGYIMITPRNSNLTEDREDTIQYSGTLGYGWTHAGNERDTASDREWSGLQNPEREDILDNAYKAEATHKAHSSGKRKDYLTSVWEIKVNIRIPTIEKGSRNAFHLYQATETLVEVEGKVMVFKLPEIVAHNPQTDEVGTISEKDLRRCRQWRPREWACPRKTVNLEETCGTALWQGRFPKLCLKHFQGWPRFVPYFHSQPGSLKYTVYVPSNNTLKVKCGTEDVWNRRDDTGVVTLSAQPLCKYRVGQTVVSVLPTLKKKLKQKSVGAELKLSEALKEAPFLSNTSWTILGRELQRNTNQAWSLLDAYRGVEEERNRGLLTKVRMAFQQGFVYLMFLLLGTSVAFILFLFIRVCKNLHKTYRHRQRERQLQREQEEQLDRLSEIDRRINKSKMGSVLTLNQDPPSSVGDRQSVRGGGRDPESLSAQRDFSALDESITSLDPRNTSLPITQPKRNRGKPTRQPSSIAGRFIGDGPFNTTQ